MFVLPFYMVRKHKTKTSKQNINKPGNVAMFSDGFGTFSDSTPFGNFHGSVDGCPLQEDNGEKELQGLTYPRDCQGLTYTTPSLFDPKSNSFSFGSLLTC